MTAGLFLGMLLLSLSVWLALRQRQEILLKSRIIEATNCGVLVTDATFPHYPVSYVNRAFLSLTGYAEHEVLGQSSAILSGPDTDRASIEKLGMALQDGRACRVCLRHYRKDCTSFWNEVTLSPMKDRTGRLISVVWIMRDVSHVHELEADLRRRPSPTFLCDRASEGMLVTKDTEVVYVNQAGVTILGAASEEQVVGQPLLNMVHQDSREMVRHRLALTQPSRDSERQRDTSLLRIDGQAVVVEMSTTPIMWEGQESVLVCFFNMSRPGQTGDYVSHRQHHLRPADEISDMHTWAWDVGRGTDLWSAEQYRILGYEPGTVPPTYDTFKKALHPEDREGVLSLVEETFNSDRPYDIDCRIIQPCGDVRFVRCRGVLVRGLPDQPIRMSGTIEDITDYKLMATLAEERVLQFKAVLESTPAGVVMVDRDGTISLINAKIELMFGHACEELLGRPVDCLFPTQDRPLYAQASGHFFTASVSRLPRTGVELHGLRKDGSDFPAEISLYPILLSSGTALLVSIADVTARQQADMALTSSQTSLDLAVQAGQVGIFEFDHRTGTFVWSPIFRKIHGIGMDESASLERYLELVHPVNHDRMHFITQCALDPGEEQVSEVEYRMVRPDGAIRDMSLLSVTWFDRKGLSPRPLRTIGMVVDITDRKKVVTHARGTSNKELIGTLSGEIVHEINNSLTSILGFSELALPLVPIDNKAHRHLTQVIAAGRKARELVQTIRRGLDHSASYPESVSPQSQAGSEPSTPQIEVQDAVGPRR